ncbi:hypothetical protein [Cellulosilyticum ruminicola]|nr:hypothetical protein [Cellulosilyticum ruminicola]
MEEKQKKQEIEEKKTNKKRPKDDILSIVKQFVGYFEEVDRNERDNHGM